MSKAQVSGHLHSQVDYDPNCAEGEPESEEEDYQSQAVDPLQQCIPDKEKTIKSRTIIEEVKTSSETTRVASKVSFFLLFILTCDLCGECSRD